MQVENKRVVAIGFGTSWFDSHLVEPNGVEGVDLSSSYTY
jgi:hypothetical protein